MAHRPRRRPSNPFSTINPHAAGIDIGATHHVVAVALDRAAHAGPDFLHLQWCPGRARRLVAGRRVTTVAMEPTGVCSGSPCSRSLRPSSASTGAERNEPTASGVPRFRSVRAAADGCAQARYGGVPDGVAGRRCRLAAGRDSRARVARHRADVTSTHRSAIRLARARHGAEGRTVTSAADDAASDRRAQEHTAPAI